jgi:hypothetical protein
MKYDVYMEQYNKIGYGPHGIIQIKNFLEEADIESLSTFLRSEGVGSFMSERCPKEVVDTLSRYEGNVYDEIVANISIKYDVPVVRLPVARAHLTNWGMLKGFSMPEHSDSETPDGKPAVAGGFYRYNITAISYITDSYIGGEISFPELGIKIKPAAGDLLLFPSRYRHEIKMYVSGERYTMPMFFTFDVEDAFTNEERISLEGPDASSILFKAPQL